MDSGLGSQGSWGGGRPGTPSEGLAAGLTGPDTHSHSPDSGFPTKLTEVDSVLVLFNLLDGFSQGSAVPSGVLANDAHLLSPLPHLFLATERLSPRTHCESKDLRVQTDLPDSYPCSQDSCIYKDMFSWG